MKNVHCDECSLSFELMFVFLGTFADREMASHIEDSCCWGDESVGLLF